MDLKEHILTALREQFDRWEELLEGLDAGQITIPHFNDAWSIKDVIAHLWAWQQISFSRLEAASLNQEPAFPKWLVESREDWEENADQTNAWIYQACHKKSWPEVHEAWKSGFLQLLEAGKPVSEKDLLDGERYPWLKGYSPAFILVASYDHHQEHFEKACAWLKTNRGGSRMTVQPQPAPMRLNRSMPPGTIIPEIGYVDVRAAVAWLCNAFGFTERLRIGDHRAQLCFSDGSIIAVGKPASQAATNSAPLHGSESGYSVMVRVEDVDAHYEQAKQRGARIIQSPADYAYGERQYTAEDLAGHRWTFSQSIADVDPAEWAVP
jgi:uncharacterized glyoxalase superfamily protein PhnB